MSPAESFKARVHSPPASPQAAWSLLPVHQNTPVVDLDCAIEENNMKVWKSQQLYPLSIIFGIQQASGLSWFQFICQRTNSSIDVLSMWNGVSFSFYTGQSRLGLRPSIFCPQGEGGFCFWENRPLGATTLKDGSCELWHVVFAFIWFLLWQEWYRRLSKAPPNPCGCFFWVGTCFIFADGILCLINIKNNGVMFCPPKLKLASLRTEFSVLSLLS